MEPGFTIEASGGAFGDGTHPTTQLLLRALEALDSGSFQPKNACDMGAGSGILSLAVAAKFGCPVLATDIERQAIETLQRNAVNNGFADAITGVHADGFDHADITARAPFDLIVMNILAEPLMRLSADAVDALAPGGLLMLSGLLHWQEEPIREAYTGLGLELLHRLSLGDWVALIFEKPA